MRAFLCFLLLIVPVAVSAQQTPADETIGQRYRVVLVDGTIVAGTLVAVTATDITLESAAGVRTTIPRAQIRAMVLATGAFNRRDPNDTRLLLFPTARSLKAGAGRFGTYTVFPTVAVGVTNNIDVSLGSSLPVDGYLITNLNLKVTPIRSERLNVAVGGSALVPIGEGTDGVGGTFYGVVTVGTSEQAFTVGGVGVYATNFEEAEVGDGGALVLGFEKQVSNNVKLLTENYLVFSSELNGALLSAGVRFFGDQLSADIAPVLIISDEDVTFLPIPYFSFSYSFGR